MSPGGGDESKTSIANGRYGSAMKRMIFGAAFVGTVLGRAWEQVLRVPMSPRSRVITRRWPPVRPTARMYRSPRTTAHTALGCEQGEDGLYYLYLST